MGETKCSYIINHGVAPYFDHILKELDDKMREEFGPEGKIHGNTGVCDLHVVHGAIKTGLYSFSWDLQTFLCDIYFIYNELPARHADFTSVTGRKVFPLKYCTTRWLENVPCLERALLLFDDSKKIMENSKAVKAKTVLNVRDQTKDKFMKCKLAFFKSLSNDCEPFLKKYQT
ncbi:hypothetical protein PR048_004802 [Dryococelus australis]|uniref:Uncharacterized protein n=1 Tax=Dryococelus australis TaxID=614101 RepID=A0ABQ9I6W7_9NEOP|nr:hypothetical protein PR048_004802 [Dryococelus australis]